MNSLVVIFLMVFVAGPLIFFRLVRPAPSLAQFRLLAGISFSTLLVSLALRFGFLGRWGSDPSLTWITVGLIWIAWVGILALGVQRLRMADPSVRMRNWTAVLGAFGTAVPWFGLASAHFMTG
ncbi:hypothetical protein [Ascidiaceihabitans sp.]|uniref:hypothetical protein n=2 Tax=Ascidiaceihabitans sp. TaxID=1872644 RepID=UPI00329A76EB